MSRTRSAEVAKRNDAIYAQWLRGASLVSLADQYGISRQVVARIVAALHPEEDEDTDRAVYRGFMWRLYDEVQEIGARPGYKLTPTGRPAEDPDGEPALDTNVQIQAKELQMKILRELRLLDGRDRQQAKTPPDLAAQQAAQDIARRMAERDRQVADDERRGRELEAQSRRIEEQQRELERIARVTGATIPGEVVRELPPAQESA